MGRSMDRKNEERDKLRGQYVQWRFVEDIDWDSVCGKLNELCKELGMVPADKKEWAGRRDYWHRRLNTSEDRLAQNGAGIIASNAAVLAKLDTYRVWRCWEHDSNEFPFGRLSNRLERKAQGQRQTFTNITTGNTIDPERRPTPSTSNNRSSSTRSVQKTLLPKPPPNTQQNFQSPDMLQSPQFLKSQPRHSQEPIGSLMHAQKRVPSNAMTSSPQYLSNYPNTTQAPTVPSNWQMPRRPTVSVQSGHENESWCHICHEIHPQYRCPRAFTG